MNINNYIVYYINLSSRPDRNNHIKMELLKIFPPDHINRINANNNKFGAIGCTCSHIDVLTKFIKSNKDICFVFEDDFQFLLSDSETINIFNIICNNNFDVIMISYNGLGIDLNINTINNGVANMVNGRTTAGYIVHKKFANKLLNNYIEGLTELMSTFDKTKYAIDMYWMKLQTKDNLFLASIPCLGTQYTSYSDIEQKVSEYIQCNTCIILLSVKKELYNPTNFNNSPFIHYHTIPANIEFSILILKQKYPFIKYLYKTNNSIVDFNRLIMLYKRIQYLNLISKCNYYNIINNEINETYKNGGCDINLFADEYFFNLI